MSEAPVHITVIVGAGQAGVELASQLRQQGYTGRLLMIGDEPHLPYRRPPLSKTYLSGEVATESLFIRSAAALEKLTLECWTSVAVTDIDRAAKTLGLADGRRQPYDKLVLATGGRARPLVMPGAEASNLYTVRNIADIERIKPVFTAGRRLVVIGGGYIGLEAAAVAIKKGLLVTVLEAAPRLLARVAAPELSAFYQRAHTKRGVVVHTGVSLKALHGSPEITELELADGSRIGADLIIVGIGLIPNTELAAQAGLAVDNGIVVNEFAETADPDILAIGDCAKHRNHFYGRAMRLESVPSALEQARTAAQTLSGKPAPHVAVPWFWSDQYDLKLQMVGLSEGYDQLVLRGNVEGENFSAFYLKQGVVISADAVNRPQDFMVAKKLVAERVAVTAAVLADESVALKSLLPAAV